MDNRIKVGVRIRPLSQRELTEGAATTVSAEPGGRVVTAVDNKKNTFSYDWAFDSNADQRTIYDDMCKPLIGKVFEGYNATFFAYGQTGAGKTYTMGTTSDFQHGVVPYCINDIFAKRSELVEGGSQVSVDLSYLEIYMEDCFDLLSRDGERKKLELRETQSGETFLDGLSTWPVMNLGEVAHFLTEAGKVRATGRTAMNSVSSRSHAICTLTIRIFRDDTTLISKLNLVDLAGSERAKKTQATGDVFQEGISINKGLLALGNVVSALSTKKSGHVHVPYRESRLTRLLKDSLGGNGMTALLACISPANVNYEETLNTLRFASRASCIVNKAEVNHGQTNDANALIREVARLHEQLLALQDKYDTLAKASSSNSQALSASSRKRQHSTESLEQQASEDMVIHLMASLKLTSALKSILMKCLNDDLVVEDDLIMTVQSELQDIRSSLGYELVGGMAMQEEKLSQSLMSELDIDGLVLEGFSYPPIITTIDELKTLELHLQSLLRKISHDSASEARRERYSGSNLEAGADEDEELMMNDMSAILREDDNQLNNSLQLDLSQVGGAGDALFIEEPSPEELEAMGAAPRDIAAKEEKIFSIVAITEQYKATIKELNEEITALEREREAFIAQNDHDVRKKADSSAAITHDTLKFKQELKQKTKLLEEKIKTLRAKEIEFNKICRVKERLVKELEAMKGKIQEYKRKKVDMMRKMREETVAHQEESKQLKFNEMQSKRKVQKAEIELTRVGQKLSNQEKFWRLKLEAKENECNRLRQLMKRQEDNRVIKEKSKLRGANSFNTAVSGGAGNGLAGSGAVVPSVASKQLQQMFREELRSQQDMARSHGMLAYEIDARRNLQQDKFNKKAKLKQLRPGTTHYKELEESIAGLEKEIQIRNKRIGQLQLHHHEQSELSANAQGSAMHRLFFLQKDMNFAQNDLQACLQKLWAMQFEHIRENSALNKKLEDLQQALRGDKEEDSAGPYASAAQGLASGRREGGVGSGVGKAGGAGLGGDAGRRRRGRMGEDDSDEDDDDEASGDMDETFLPSDEDSESSSVVSYDSEPSKPRARGKRARGQAQSKANDDEQTKSSKRSRPSTDSMYTDSTLSDESMDSQEVAKKTAGKKGAAASAAPKKVLGEEALDAIKSSKWFSMTIKELKVELSQRKLPVSGVKNELVLRLLSYEQQQQQQQHQTDEDLAMASPTVVEDAPASDVVMDPLSTPDHAANLEAWKEVPTCEKNKPAPLIVEVDGINDENEAVDLNVISPKPSWRKGLEMGKQLLSPLRSLVNNLQAGEGAVVKEQVLSKDEELFAFRSRFQANRF